MARKALGCVAVLAGAAAVMIAVRQIPRRRISGRTVLVTGGSRGLGLELARDFLAAGANVAICSRHREELERAMRELAPNEERLSIHVADISDPQAIERLVSEVTSRWGRLDVLVNNAGVFASGPMALMRPDDYRRMLEINLMGTIMVTEACRPYLENKGGVITIVSAAGLLPAPHVAPYAVSKAGLSMYAQLLEVELADRGMETMVVYPSYMPTGVSLHAEYRGAVASEQRALQRFMHLPFFSKDHRRAAALIVNGWRTGRKVLVYPVGVRMGTALIGVMPEFMLNLLRQMNRHYPTREQGASGRQEA